uniref:Uncharacterized protein n=1 Tax=Cacopsylla melanoneura TaxID=428564 RepID=A0A8D8LU35_9HEMI
MYFVRYRFTYVTCFFFRVINFNYIVCFFSFLFHKTSFVLFLKLVGTTIFEFLNHNFRLQVLRTEREKPFYRIYSVYKSAWTRLKPNICLISAIFWIPASQSICAFYLYSMQTSVV